MTGIMATVHRANTGDPLFMVGAVAVGMFHRADLGIIIAGAHYISSIIVGLVMRFYRGEEDGSSTLLYQKHHRKNIFGYALRELIEARKNDGRTMGELLGDSVRESVNTLLMVGGFIILFSVVTEIFILTGFIEAFSGLVMLIMRPLGLTGAMVLPLVSGFFEITNGTNLASLAQAPLLHQVIIANAVIAWSGLSVHAQVATMTNGTDIKLKPYVFARILQAVLSGLITVFLFIPYQKRLEAVFLPLASSFTPGNGILLILLIFTTIMLISLAVSLLIYTLRRVGFIFFHSRS